MMPLGAIFHGMARAGRAAVQEPLLGPNGFPSASLGAGHGGTQGAMIGTGRRLAVLCLPFALAVLLGLK